MPSISEELVRDAAEISRSGLVHGGWYAATYPDVAATGLRASQHYVWIGARMGRDPNPHFRTRRYAEANGLTDEGAMNPLLHHVRHGRPAGQPPGDGPGLAEVQRLAWHLWGALPGPAGEALAAVADDPSRGERVRAEALLRLAMRAAFDGRPEAAAALLDRIGEVAPSRAGARGVLLRRGALAGAVGDEATARERLGRIPPIRGLHGEPEPDPDAALVLAGLEADDGARLAALSAVLERRGLEALVLIDPGAPLTLANLAAAPAPRALPGMGRVSVIVPAHEAAGSLPAALRSLAAQSYPDLEILVVDDASRDATFETASAAARRDPRIRPLRAERNGGAYAARNLGLAHATGEFVTTHDADDWSHPRKIETQLRAFLRDPLTMATTVTWARVRADLRCTTGWRLDDAVMHMSYSSLMLRREAARRLGPWDEIRAGADSEYLWRARAVLGREAVVHLAPGAPLAFGLDEAGSLTRAGATHLVTNHHGLRHLYREVVRHHLRTAPDPTDPEGRAAALRRVPREMRGPAPPPGPLDLCLRGDLFDPAAVARIAAILADPALAAARVGILHEPALESRPDRFAEGLWTFLDGERVRLLVSDPGPGGAARTVALAPSAPRDVESPPVTAPPDAGMAVPPGTGAGGEDAARGDE